MGNRFCSKFLFSVKFLLLPALLAAYPVVFHYSNNIGVALFSSAVKLLLFYICIAIVVYMFLLIISGFQPIKAANASTTFIIFLLTYGLSFVGLKKVDIVHIEHYSLLPVYIFLGCYFAWLIYRLNKKASLRIWKGGVSILAVLLVFNVGKIVYGLLPVLSFNKASPSVMPTAQIETNLQDYPDIYYIIFDEMAGFEVARRYWKYDGINDFVNYLQTKGFYVAENSHSSSLSTLEQMATRLNYTPIGGKNFSDIQKQQKILDNSAMQYMKSLGYTTVVFTELNGPCGFPAMPSMVADFVYERPPQTQEINNDIFLSDNIQLSSFEALVLKNTLFFIFLEDFEIGSKTLIDHQSMIAYTVKTVPTLDIPTPKFIYIHLVIPHLPFVFDKYGKIKTHDHSKAWNNYFEQYVYSLKLAKKLIDDILDASKSQIPPVIILQSDHGARNIDYKQGVLKDYPEEYRSWIVNAWYTPGCVDAPLTQDMDPINTFPILFNCYFNANIPLQ